MCLATAGRADPYYTIVASVNLHASRIEEVDNGRGERCPFITEAVSQLREKQDYNVTRPLSPGNLSLSATSSYMK
jgi:hypothetical protein